MSTELSKLWQGYFSTHITEDIPLDNFRSNQANYKIALWDPATRGEQYLRMLLFNLANTLSPTEWSCLRHTHNRQIGNPIGIVFKGEFIDLDYLQAALESTFIYNHITAQTILEIGGGYGRTCHTIMSSNNIQSYTIADFPNMLKLANEYLQKLHLDFTLYRSLHDCIRVSWSY